MFEGTWRGRGDILWKMHRIQIADGIFGISYPSGLYDRGEEWEKIKILSLNSGDLET